MNRIKTWFDNGAPAQFGYDTKGLICAICWGGAACAFALAHRALGYFFPHHVFFRNWEVLVSRALPSVVEHAFTAFGVVSLLTILFAGRRATVRVRVFATVICAVGYFVSTTVGWDYYQFLTTHDSAQLAQMGGDVAGLFLALAWLCWPSREAGLLPQVA